jgi:hypothetical protein
LVVAWWLELTFIRSQLNGGDGFLSSEEWAELEALLLQHVQHIAEAQEPLLRCLAPNPVDPPLHWPFSVKKAARALHRGFASSMSPH